MGDRREHKQSLSNRSLSTIAQWLHSLWPPSKGDSRISLKQWFCLQLLIISDKEYIGKREKKASLKRFKPDDK